MSFELDPSTRIDAPGAVRVDAAGTERVDVASTVGALVAALGPVLGSEHDLVIFTDADGTIVWSSAAPSSADLPTTPQHGVDLGFAPQDWDELVAAIQKPDTQFGPVSARMVHPDGVARTMSVRAHQLATESGRFGIIVARDITDAERNLELVGALNAALVESTEALAAIIATAPVAIATFDFDGTVLVWNPAYEAMTGWAAGSVVGSPDPTIPDDAFADVAALQRRVFQGMSVEALEGGAICRDNSYVEVVRSLAPLRDAQGAVVCGVMMTVDVSALRSAERHLRSEEQRMHAMLQHADDIIVLLDADTEVLFVSPSIERILGYQAVDNLRSLTQCIAFDDHQRFDAHLSETMTQSGVHGPIELQATRADGSWCVLEIVTNNRVEDPAVAGIIMTARDVTHQRQAATMLAESEARYRRAVEDQTELLARVDATTGVITFANAAFDALFGRRASGGSIVALRTRVHDADRDVVGEAVATAQLGIEPGMGEIRIAMLSGEFHWFRCEFRPVATEYGDSHEVQIVGRDITERKSSEMRVGDEARILEMIAKTALIEEILGELSRFVERSIPGAFCTVHVPIEDGLGFDVVAPSITSGLTRALGDSRIPASVAWIRAAVDGREVHADLGDLPIEVELQRELGVHSARAIPVMYSGNERVAGVLTVLTPAGRSDGPFVERTLEAVSHLATIAFDRQAYMASMAYQAHHDPLTGLPNRALFLEVLTLALARIRRMRTAAAVLFLDLDRFKVVNDSLGHDPGDQLLSAVAARLQGAIRPGDVLARFGGDEFTILCDLSGPEAEQQAVQVAERLIDVIHQPFSLAGDEVFLGASIGIALASTGDEKPEALLRDADAAMYRAKERGKGRWELFDEAMRASAMRRLELENALHRALERNEFRVFFQPLLDITTGACVGAEGLVRWQHPERGLVPPGDFITLSEETGLITAIGAWVLDAACAQAAEWLAQRRPGAPFAVSVNLSARQLAQADLVDQVAAALARHDIPASALCLEITESVLMEDAEWAIGSIRALRNLGVKLSIDDFGTGYSSLGYLKRFPVDSVKVDRSFVDGLGSDPEDSAIVAAVISLGHALGLQIVAEGVETEQQLAELQRLGCECAQGFLFAPPQPAADIAAIVVRGRRW
ncbi:MAG: EAL domain-containing protein [Acidimicrobiia bacterium]